MVGSNRQFLERMGEQREETPTVHARAVSSLLTTCKRLEVEQMWTEAK